MATITGWVLKDTKDSLVGIAFSQDTPGAPLTIKYIYKGGLFDSTDLVPGLKVVSINDVLVTGKSAEEVAELMKQLDGKVSVTAEGVRASVEKPTKDSKVGISLSDENGVVIISVINPLGLFASSGLRVGQRVVSINGYVCPPSAASAVTIVQEASKLTIVAASVAVEDCVTVSDYDDSSSNVVIREEDLRPDLPAVVSSRSLTSGKWSGSMVTAISH
jgi:C-terminal processing protease CtpA/Prc